MIQAFCNGSHPMDKCCAWPQEDDGDGSSDYGQSDYDAEEDQP